MRALEHLYATGAQVLIATERGDGSAARALLETLRADYALLLAPLVTSTQPELSQNTLELMSSLAASPALRLQDAAVLLGQLQLSAEVLGGCDAEFASRDWKPRPRCSGAAFVRLALLHPFGRAGLCAALPPQLGLRRRQPQLAVGRRVALSAPSARHLRRARLPGQPSRSLHRC